MGRAYDVVVQNTSGPGTVTVSWGWQERHSLRDRSFSFIRSLHHPSLPLLPSQKTHQPRLPFLTHSLTLVCVYVCNVCSDGPCVFFFVQAANGNETSIVVCGLCGEEGTEDPEDLMVRCLLLLLSLCVACAGQTHRNLEGRVVLRLLFLLFLCVACAGQTCWKTWTGDQIFWFTRNIFV